MITISHVPGGPEHVSKQKDATARPKYAPLESVPRVPSQALFVGAQEVAIDHHGTVYRLRKTAQGKLILTK